MNFAKNSFIVNNKLQLAIVDKRIPKNMETNLNNMGVSIIKSTCCSNTYEAIKYHPDISVCKLNDNNIVVAKIKTDDTAKYENPKSPRYNLHTIGFHIHKTVCSTSTNNTCNH